MRGITGKVHKDIYTISVDDLCSLDVTHGMQYPEMVADLLYIAPYRTVVMHNVAQAAAVLRLPCLAVKGSQLRSTRGDVALTDFHNCAITLIVIPAQAGIQIIIKYPTQWDSIPNSNSPASRR